MNRSLKRICLLIAGNSSSTIWRRLDLLVGGNQTKAILNDRHVSQPQLCNQQTVNDKDECRGTDQFFCQPNANMSI
jgi:hypothetical protein